ncbi:MAG: hypothetical protein ABH817_01505 [archaeon]
MDRPNLIIKEHHYHHRGWPWFLLGVIFVILLMVFVYFFVISPVIPKPDMQNPNLLDGSDTSNGIQILIGDGHLAYILNELGFYKAHSNPTNGEIAMVQIYLADLEKNYYFTTEKGKVIPLQGMVSFPDLKISTTQNIILEILESGDVTESLKQKINTGQLGVDILKSEGVLAAKGYLSVYTSLVS